MPIGQWELGNPVNIGFNRWVVDTTAAVTYLDQTTGLELSGAVGLTYNFENPDTDYKSGTELHAEGAAMMHLSHTFSIGVNGYALRQITGDSGSGAVLGDFEGQVFAIGPALDYTFKIGQLPGRDQSALLLRVRRREPHAGTCRFPERRVPARRAFGRRAGEVDPRTEFWTLSE